MEFPSCAYSVAYTYWYVSLSCETLVNSWDIICDWFYLERLNESKEVSSKLVRSVIKNQGNVNMST